MPAASCRIMPARSISRCETISASFGFSFRMGRKNRDNRMGFGSRGFGGNGRRSQTGLPGKTQGRGAGNGPETARFLVFSADLRLFDDDWRFDIELIVVAAWSWLLHHVA